MKSLIKNTLNSQGFKQSLQVTLANIFATGLGAIAIIILSRVLNPVGFGIFSVAFSLLAILAKVADVGINIAMQKKLAQTFESDKKIALKYVFEAGKIKLALVLAIAIAGWFLTPSLDTNFLKLNNPFIIRLSFVFAIVLVFFDYLQYILQSIRSFTDGIIMTIIQAVFKISATIAFAISGSKNVLIGFSFYGIGPLIAILFGYIVLPSWLKNGFENAKKERRELIAIAKFTAIAVIAGTVADNIDTLLVQKYMTTYDTGIFSAASKVALLFSTIAYSIGSVLNPRVARYRERYQLDKYLKKTFPFAALIIILFFILIPFSKYLILISAGAKYLPGAASLQILLISSALFVITMPYIAIFYALDKPNYFALSGILQITILVASDVILIPLYGINGASYARFLARCIVFIFTFIYAIWSIKKTSPQITRG